jgi:hypothetical protein
VNIKTLIATAFLEKTPMYRGGFMETLVLIGVSKKGRGSGKEPLPFFKLLR